MLGNGYVLDAGQSILGRTSDYKQLAQGNQRALLEDTLFLNGNNNVVALQINGQSNITNSLGSNPAHAGIVINPSATGTIQIDNVNVTTTTNTANLDAIGIVNSSLNANVNLFHSNVAAIASGANSNASGLINLGRIQIEFSNLSGTDEGISNGR